ncbi:MAG: hypothetical protein ABR973_14755 [Candidatus Acidiferrales bacterium]|jgi:hypothetical protein
MEPKYEEQFTAFIDFLGFGEVSAKSDEDARMKILDLLLALSAQRGEFDMQSTVQGATTTTRLRPAISTFSDHIVISYPLEAIRSVARPGVARPDEYLTARLVLHDFCEMSSRIAAAALQIGFLIRGGASIGPLYHSKGVVFGEALIDAFGIESRTSVYPRVVLSRAITSRPNWIENKAPFIAKDDN